MGARIPRRRAKCASLRGHYAGTTSQREPISFDLTDHDGVTNLIATVSTANHSEVLSVSAVLPVADDGHWGGMVSASDLTVRIQGHLRPDGKASGTLDAAFDGTGPGSMLGALEVSWFAQRVADT